MFKTLYLLTNIRGKLKIKVLHIILTILQYNAVLSGWGVLWLHMCTKLVHESQTLNQSGVSHVFVCCPPSLSLPAPSLPILTV